MIVSYLFIFTDSPVSFFCFFSQMSKINRNVCNGEQHEWTYIQMQFFFSSFFSFWWIDKYYHSMRDLNPKANSSHFIKYANRKAAGRKKNSTRRSFKWVGVYVCVQIKQSFIEWGIMKLQDDGIFGAIFQTLVNALNTFFMLFIVFLFKSKKNRTTLTLNPVIYSRSSRFFLHQGKSFLDTKYWWFMHPKSDKTYERKTTTIHKWWLFMFGLRFHGIFVIGKNGPKIYY